jgi:hypothetical protein
MRKTASRAQSIKKDETGETGQLPQGAEAVNYVQD